MWLALTAAAAPRLELVVVGPGDSQYTLYGHAGVVAFDQGDEPLSQARLFNFGITDFRRPNYIVDFLGGRVDFWGHERDYQTYLDRWTRHDREVVRYPLNLGPDATKALLLRMRDRVREETKHYRYDTFRENCATRIRDLLDAATGGAVYGALAGVPTGRSFRDDVRQAYAGQPALLLLTEIFPGPALDEPRDAWAMAYRPVALARGLATVTLPDGTPLLGEPHVDRRREGPDPRTGNPNRAQIFLWIISVVLLAMSVVIVGAPPWARGIVLAGWLAGDVLLGGALLWVALTTAWPDMQGSPLLLSYSVLDVGLFWTAGVFIIRRGERGGRWARGWLWVRLGLSLSLLALSPFVSALNGPIAPRAVGVAGVALALRCAGVGADARGVFKRLLRWPLRLG
ncbi:MAG: DUF4105 domain-containing protein [Myxococcales bacterium]|nr:DUF4105 domain-containing protein [Myxococcales bacterium]MCB9525392.1 DUF4105 domain-containing protein [Myxococcales bacterium]